MTNDRKQGPEGARAGLQEVGNVEPPNNANQQLQARRAREMRAKKYNQEHAKEASEFQKLTGVDPMNIAAVKKWQGEHGVAIDGKIGPTTLQAAKPQASEGESSEDGGAPQDSHPEEPGGGRDGRQTEKHKKHQTETEVTFGENEGSTIEGHSDVAEEGGEVLENPALVDNILDGAGGLGHAPNEDLGTGLEGSGDVPGRLGEARHVVDTVEGANEPFEPSPWLKAAMLPAIVNLLREGQFGEAAKKMLLTFSPSEVFEGLRVATEKLGLKVGENALKWLIEYGAEADVLFAGLMWTLDGIEAVQRAREEGDAESRIRMYAHAFADGFLEGENGDGGRAGAVTAEQKEAVDLGLRDGMGTAGHFGECAAEVGRELIRRCGGEGAVKRMLMDKLAKRAGLKGVWS